MKTKVMISAILAITLISSFLAAIPSGAAIQCCPRAVWTDDARNDADNYLKCILNQISIGLGAGPMPSAEIESYWLSITEAADDYAVANGIPVTSALLHYLGCEMLMTQFPSIFPTYASADTFLSGCEATCGWPPSSPVWTYLTVSQSQYCFYPAKSVGTLFNVSVCVQNVTDLKGVACKLGYNSSVIQAVRVFPTSITSSATKWLPVDSSGVFHWDANPTINNTAYPPGNRSYLYQGLMPFCYVWINAWGFTPFTSPNPTVLSPVFNIEFEVMMTPPIETVTSPLNMCYCTPLDLFPYPSCELLNHNSVDIPFAPLDGCFCNIQPQHVIGWPTAVCSVYPSIVNVGSAVTFDGSASSDGGAPPLEYIWAITSGPTITTNSTTTTYTTSTPGTYTVTLTVVNKMGLNNTASPQSWTVVKPVGCITDLFTGPTRWCGQQTKFTGVGLANWTDYAQWLAGVAGAGNPLRNPGFVDALTPDVNLSLYTSVSFDGAPRANVLVAFQIIYEYALIDQSKGFPAGYDAINYTVDVRTAMTNTSGIAVTWFRIPMSMPGIPTWDGLPFGKWLVVATCKVQEVKQLDWIRFDVGYPVWITKVTTFNPVTKAAATTFSVGSSIGITVTAKNIMFIPKDVLLVCTVYDVCDVPIGYCFIALTASPATIYDTPHYFTENNTVVIPQWAYVGTPAYVYADAYTTWPVLLGEAYCPELSAIITITT